MIAATLRPHRRRLIWLSATLTVALLFIAVLPELMRYGAMTMLERQGVERVSIRDIDFNPFNGTFELRRLQTASGLVLDHVKLRLDWWPLWKQRLAVTEFRSSHLDLTLKQRPDGTFAIGGIAIPATASQPVQETAPATWHLSLPEADISDIALTVELAASKEGTARTIHLSLDNLHLQMLSLSPQEFGLAALRLSGFKADDSAGALPKRIGHITLTDLYGDPGADHIGVDKIGVDRIALPDRNGTQLGHIDSIELDGMQLRQLADNPTLAAKQLAVAGIVLPSDASHALGRIDGIRADVLEADAHHATMQALTLNGLNGDLLRRKDGSIAMPKLSSKADSAAKSEKEKTAPFALRIGKLATSGDNRLSIRDESVTPAFKSNIDIRRFSLTPLVFDTSGKGKPERGRLATAIRLDGQTSLTADGSLTPDPGRFAMDIHAALKNLNLSRLSPYVEQETDIAIHTGKLDLNSKAKVADGQLQSRNGIHIRRLQVQAGKNAPSANGIPIDMALDMIRDDKGDIELDVPLDGPLNDLRTGIGDIVNKAMMTAMQKAAIFYAAQYLYPYGAIIPAISTIRKIAGAQPALTPANFAPGAAELDEKTSAYADKIAAMLKAKQGIRLQVCGVTAAAEFTTDDKNPQRPNEEQLLDLARQRSTRVIHAITAHGIDPERLFACKPEIDPAPDAKGRVDLLLQ